MSDEKPKPPAEPEPSEVTHDGGRIARLRKAASKLIGITAIGGGGGTAGGLLTLIGDRSGDSMVQSIKWGVLLGGIGGLFKVIHDGPWAWFREYKADEHRQARIEAERKAADAERKLAECETRYAGLVHRFDKLEADHERMSAKLDGMRADYDSSIAKAEERYSRLWERYERDRNKALESDQPA